MKRAGAVAVVIAVLGCGQDPGVGSSEDAARVARTGGTPTGATGFEVMWMTQMIDHHAMAVEMGEDCLAGATHPELLELCGDVVETQTTEIGWMTSWLADWYGVTYTAGSGGMMMGGEVELSGLTGAELELAFLEEMIPHHVQAVHMSQACTWRAEHPELADLCRSIIETQTAEIESMQQWLCDWYDRCGTTACGGGMDGVGGTGGGMPGPGPGPMMGR
jgi:uncharacterized protein (DUF305 family)